MPPASFQVLSYFVLHVLPAADALPEARAAAARLPAQADLDLQQPAAERIPDAPGDAHGDAGISGPNGSGPDGSPDGSPDEPTRVSVRCGSRSLVYV